MSSKLEKHVELISARLKEGASYTQICSELDALGCPTSRQNLVGWLTRRAARIQARQRLADPLGALAVQPQAFAHVQPTPSVQQPPSKGTSRSKPNADKSVQAPPSPANKTPPTAEELEEITRKSQLAVKQSKRLL